MSDPEYHKGYVAGRRKTEAEFAEARRMAESAQIRDRDFMRAVFLAALPGIIARPWQTDGEAHTTVDQMVGVAVAFARQAGRHMP
jgi:hypothetical protein